jgi:hypothetical protein
MRKGGESVLGGYEWIVLVLASFRLTRLLIHDQITGWLRKPFLEVKEDHTTDQPYYYIEPKGKGLRRWLGMLLSCYWCMGVWTTAFLYISWILLSPPSIYVIHILALAGAAAILEAFFKRYME